MIYYLETTERLAEEILEAYNTNYQPWACFTLEIPDEDGDIPVSVDYGYEKSGDFSERIDDLVSPMSPGDDNEQLGVIMANLESLADNELETALAEKELMEEERAWRKAV